MVQPYGVEILMGQTPVVVVSGAATGIGRRIAERFEEGGFRLAIGDANPAAVADFRAAHPGCLASVVDVSDWRQVDAWFDEIEARFGRIDVLVNNAGIAGPTAPVEKIEPADWDRTIAVDLNGQFYCARRAVPLLRAAGGGSIISIASSAAFYGCPLRTPYVASKWALMGFNKTLAMELGPEGIRVNTLCPGCVKGPRIDGVIERDAAARGMTAAEIRKVYERQVSLRQFVDADDVANLAFFIASPQGRMISGQVIGVDGHTESLANWLDD
jgi:NAD(P)-dependent dehydrogenase (short-subunit alcohol dehydrogenase family)